MELEEKLVLIKNLEISVTNLIISFSNKILQYAFSLSL